ncbi:MAG: hypothetical protein J6B04_01280 [Clostridia bacterium]|nr:hypothetical protein [Clostridia bacterium]
MQGYFFVISEYVTGGYVISPTKFNDAKTAQQAAFKKSQEPLIKRSFIAYQTSIEDINLNFVV